MKPSQLHLASIFFALVFAMPVLGLARAAEKAEAQARNVTIEWDDWGVPHIDGEDPASVAYAYGWAQMKSHANVLVQRFGASRGRAAEYWGEKYLEDDIYLRTMGIPEQARLLEKKQSKRAKEIVSSFVRGMNDYLEAHPDVLDEENRQVLPLQSTDVLAHLRSVLYLTFVAGRDQVMSKIKGAETTSAGSNAWAIAPERSASGNAMLLANPHLPWAGDYLFYEAQLTTNGKSAYGVSLLGWPFLAIAFNEHLGWTHTVNTYDGTDLYKLTLNESGEYKFGDDFKRFKTRHETIKVLNPDSTYREQDLAIASSKHGPVFANDGKTAYALKVAGLDNLDHAEIIDQYWDMSYASNFDEFEKALSRLQMPMFNTVYADQSGTIFYAFNALQPKRSSGDVAFWAEPVDGADKSLLWKKYRTYSELPHYANPASGFIQNSNDPPWTSTFPQVLHAKDFPPDYAPEFMHFRAQSGARMLVDDPQISFDELTRYRSSTRLSLADAVLDDLIADARKSKDPLLLKAAATLANWDRQTTADSAGAILFQAWVTALMQKGVLNDEFYKEKWTADRALETPRGIAKPEEAIAALRSAAADTVKNFGDIKEKWGDAVRIEYGGKDLPANVGPGFLGAFSVAFTKPTSEGRFQVFGGNTYTAAIEFGKKVTAKAILAYGNSTEKNSPHLGDQLGLFTAGDLRDIWFYKGDLDGHVAEEEVLTVH